MECSICTERAEGAPEFFRLGGWVFDVNKAKQIAGKKHREIHQVSAEEVRSLALMPPPREGYSNFGGFHVDEEHLSHIPDPTEPVMFATFPDPPRLKKDDCPFVLDGHHRMVRAAHEGRGVSAYLLTANETRRCMLPESRSRLRRLR